MKEARPCRRPIGAVSLEFLIAFPTLWVFGLCVFQLVMLARADLLVRHAADSAARSAAVVLMDDPVRYGGEPEGSVSPEPGLQGRLSESTREWAQDSKASSVFATVIRSVSLRGRTRRDTIAAAARVPLLSLGTSLFGAAGRPTLESSIGPRALPDALSAALPGFSIEFPEAHNDRVAGPEVTVAVNVSYLCRVPVARHIVCGRSRKTGERLRHIRHASTLLIHDAPYRYRAEREG